MNFKKFFTVLVLFNISFAQHLNAELHDRGGGLIYDDVLDVTWLQNANYGAGSAYDNANFTTRPDELTDGRMTWFNAMEWVANLEYYDSVRDVVWDDWRLPEVKCWVNGESFNRSRSNDGSTDVGLNITSTCSELAYMYYVNLKNLGRKNTEGELQDGQGMIDDPDDPKDESLFIGLDPKKYQNYWYSTIRPDNASNVFDFRADNGNVAAANWHYDRLAWAVRDGDVAVIDPVDPGDPVDPPVDDPNIAVGQMTTNIYIPSLDNTEGNYSLSFIYYGMSADNKKLWALQDKTINSPPIVDENSGTYTETNIYAPSVNYYGLLDDMNIWIELIYYGEEDNVQLWQLNAFGEN